jgi:hypothetical protein
MNADGPLGREMKRLAAEWAKELDDLDAKAREIAAGLCEFEAGVLAALATGTPKRWGAAAGQAYEVLRTRRCVTETFAITDLGRAVARVLAEGGGT